MPTDFQIRPASGDVVALSRYFMPTLRETPGEAEIISHQLMLRAGMTRQSAAGIYTWLPLGLRALRKIERIIREEQSAAGAHEMLMPTVQPAGPWRESGRYDSYGREMLRLTDRHGREMLYGPTNEEAVTGIFRDIAGSHRDCPMILYHIQWKFRDEVRPRFGVMRGREFLMKDGYSFDMTVEESLASYRRMFVAYLRTFARMGLRAVPMRAETGPIGGQNSHEFIILADTGESRVFCHRDFLERDPLADAASTDAERDAAVKSWTGPYAATEEMHDPDRFAAEVPADRQVSARGIEVGHIFHFGAKYSEPLGALLTDRSGARVPAQMGSYGIGVSRLVAAIIEACHDGRGIVWPDAVAPFHAAAVNLRPGDAACDALCADLCERLSAAGLDVLHDDRAERAGVKFADMDLIGLPWQVIVGPRGAAADTVEIKRRATGETQTVPPAAVAGILAGAAQRAKT